MKIYISADIEGISGVVNNSFTMPQGHEYQRARKLMTDEVNAAVKGAKEAGASEILVNDSHGPMTNILIEDLDEEVVLISGDKKPLGMMEGIDSSYDAVLLIGYHSRHNAAGVLAHSYHGRVISEIKINHKIVGEFEFNTLVAGYYRVPVVFVSGDDVLAQQVKAFDEKIENLIVKKAISRYTAESLQPKKVHRLIEEGVYKSLKEESNNLTFHSIDGPIELEITFLNSGMAEYTLLIPGVELIEANKVRYIAKNIVEAYKMRTALTTLAAYTL
ncbi:M55 family metallopeptidase [Alkaliphilus serpentinus]|uniref:M55 family metallopeptidase n=1 Tax=Alkaliphilus serpentinus TaxID=1482731 RepID=A0A833HQ97_9FIRM|nr:M55 family metallopeptidase [Alkaliphilus serpentinus]KAB3531588.1 M55 family metallopeptidase [Alkaliphilus serpentinus]